MRSRIFDFVPVAIFLAVVVVLKPDFGLREASRKACRTYAQTVAGRLDSSWYLKEFVFIKMVTDDSVYVISTERNTGYSQPSFGRFVLHGDSIYKAAFDDSIRVMRDDGVYSWRVETVDSL